MRTRRGQVTHRGGVSIAIVLTGIALLVVVAGLCGHPHAYTERRTSVFRGACVRGLCLVLEGSLGAGTHAGRALGAHALLCRGQHAAAGAVGRRVHDHLRDVADASKRIGKSVAGCCQGPAIGSQQHGSHVELYCCASIVGAPASGEPAVGGVLLHHKCTTFTGVLIIRLTCSASPPNQTCLPSKAVESD